MKLTFLDKLGIGLLALGLSAILGPPTISFFKDRLQNNFQHITCYGENNKPIANFGVNWTGVNVGKDLAEAWIKILVPIHELKAEGLTMQGSSYGTVVAVKSLNSAESNRIDKINTINLTEASSVNLPVYARVGRTKTESEILRDEKRRNTLHRSSEQKRSKSFSRQDLRKDEYIRWMKTRLASWKNDLRFWGIDASLQKHRGTENLSVTRSSYDSPENVKLHIGELPDYYRFRDPGGPGKKNSGNYGVYIEFLYKSGVFDLPDPDLDTWGQIFFKNCRYSSPRFFKNTDLIVPYDAEQI